MKAYVLMTSLALLAGAAIGYASGKSAALTTFAGECAASSFAVVYDYGSEEHRLFHCFEVEAAEAAGDDLPREVFVL